MKFQRLTSVVLAGVLTISTIPYNVLAASGEITADKGSSQVPAKVTAEAAQFSVTVPAILPIDVSADGEVTTADDVKIVNNSASPVKVTKVSVEAINDWQLAEFDSDFTRMRVNEKKFGLQLQTNNVQTDGTCGLNGFTAIPGNGGELPLAYDANLTTQTTAIDHLNIANVTFTIGWDDGTTSDGEDSEQFTVTYTSDGNGTVNESSRTFKQGAYITFPDTTPLEGYVFDKWIDNNTQSEVTEEIIVNSEMTVKALFVNTAEKEAAKYYTFTDDPTTGGWKVGLKSEFKSALNSNSSFENWNDGEPLPALPSTYQGKPVTSLKLLFSNLKVDTLMLDNLDTSNVTDMTGMFMMCKLTSLDLSNLDTSNVTSMEMMFNSCSNLNSLDLGSIDTSKVTSMKNMFASCISLTSLDLSKFDTSKVTNMNSMFSSCNKLDSLNISKLDTSNVTDMVGMFYGCSKLASLDLSNLDTSNVTSMDRMFANCSSLTSLDLSNFNTSSVTNMKSLFNGCSGLTSLNISELDTSSVSNMESMFNDCYGLTSLDLSNFNTSSVTNMDCMFDDCNGLVYLDLSSFDTSKVGDKTWNIFFNCNSLATCYARTQEDCNKLNSSPGKPSNVNFVVKL